MEDKRPGGVLQDGEESYERANMPLYHGQVEGMLDLVEHKYN